MKKNNGLGRGLEHLFNREENTIPSDNGNEVKFIAIEKIKPNIHQPRKQFDEASLQELASSIKNQGIVQPLIVRKSEHDNSYEIVAGERRYRAGKKLGLQELPVIIRKYTDIEAMTIALIENLQREDLNSIDEAEALNQLKTAHNLSQEELAEKIGKSRSNVANTLRLLALPEKIKALIASDRIKAGHGRALLGITDKKAQEIVCNAIMERDLTVRDVETALEYWKQHGLLPKEYLHTTAKQSKKNEKTPLLLSKSLQDIDFKLKDIFHKKASIKGTEEKGSIKINYKNKDELLYILSVFSIDSKEL